MVTAVYVSCALKPTQLCLELTDTIDREPIYVAVSFLHVRQHLTLINLCFDIEGCTLWYSCLEEMRLAMQHHVLGLIMTDNVASDLIHIKL